MLAVNRETIAGVGIIAMALVNVGLSLHLGMLIRKWRAKMDEAVEALDTSEELRGKAQHLFEEARKRLDELHKLHQLACADDPPQNDNNYPN